MRDGSHLLFIIHYGKIFKKTAVKPSLLQSVMEFLKIAIHAVKNWHLQKSMLVEMGI